MFFVVYFLFFILLQAKAFFCPDGSIPYFNDKTQCVYFKSNKTYFLDAEEICMDLGGHLASVHNQFENMFLSQTAILNFTVSVNTDFWSGANDLGNTGIWAWMDGTPFDFKDWDTEQPKNTSGNDCGTIIMQGGKWIADDCFKEKPFVCLVKALEATTAIPITTTTTLKPKPTKCPVSYTYYNATEFCYVIFGNETWVNAENRCEIDGAHLASIHDITESLFIAHMAFPDNTVPHLWMGLYTEDKNAHWQWTDKTSFDYPSWQPGQPDSPGIENCGVLWNNGNFNNLDCAFMTKYVCKILPS